MIKVFLAVTVDIAAAATGIILMAASAWLITSASFRPPLSALAVGITLVRAAGLFKAVFRYLDRYLSHEIMFRALVKIQLELYKQALKLFPLKSGAVFEAQILHDLAVWADLLKDRFVKVIQPLMSTILITAVVTAYLYAEIDVKGLLLPLSMLLTLILSYICREELQVSDTAYRERLLDFYDGFAEIKASNGTEEIVNKLDEAAEELKQSEYFKQIKTVNVDTICTILNAALMLWILKELAWQVDLINLSIWLFILLVIFEMFNALPAVVRNSFDAVSLPNDDLVINSTFRTQNTAFRIENLSFGYRGSNKVVNNLNLEVKRSEKIAIMGESGSGKTTLLYLMLGLWKADSGKIFVNGSIAAATVNNYIFSKSIRENFSILHQNITEEELHRVLKICQLDTLEIDRELGENGSKISGGERNRLQTALALAANSDILILDEPTAGLDKNIAADLINAIISEANEKDRTLIIITHDLAVAKMMDKIYRLRNAEITCGD